MKISAIIPAFNAERTIARALHSVLAQTRPADEILVIDDGSTDKTAEAVRAFGDRVRLITQANAGASVARNTGIKSASGDWIAFLDADDEWLEAKLALQSEHLTRHPELKWTFSNMSWDKEKKGVVLPIHPTDRLSAAVQEVEYFEDYFSGYMEGFFASTITLMIHRSVFDQVGLFEPGMKRAQDNDLWFRIAYQFPRIGYLPQSLSVYHLDTPGSSTKVNDQVDFMVQLINRHLALSEKFNRAEAFRPCVTAMVQTWIRELAGQSRRSDIGLLMRHYKPYLSARFVREIRFRTAIPVLGPFIADTVHRVKRSRRAGR
jgi:glycosyltransferase involved in cell wall biosynthesis